MLVLAVLGTNAINFFIFHKTTKSVLRFEKQYFYKGRGKFRHHGIISRNFNLNWLEMFCVLAPQDLFLWRFVKDMLYIRNNPRYITEPAENDCRVFQKSNHLQRRNKVKTENLADIFLMILMVEDFTPRRCNLSSS